MSSTDYEFQTSFKTAGGTLINIPANTPDEARAKMEHLQALAPTIAATEALLNGTSNAGSIAAPPQQQAPPQQPPVNPDPWGTGAPQQQQQPPAQQAPPSGAPTCPHGARVWKSGVSKATNKPWAGWMCPAPKGTPGQCDPEWDRSYGK